MNQDERNSNKSSLEKNKSTESAGMTKFKQHEGNVESDEHTLKSSEENKGNFSEEDIDKSTIKSKSNEENLNAETENNSKQGKSSEESNEYETTKGTEKSSKENIRGKNNCDNSEKEDEVYSVYSNNRMYTPPEYPHNSCLTRNMEMLYDGEINNTKSGHACQNWYTNKKEKKKIFPLFSFPSRL